MIRRYKDAHTKMHLLGYNTNGFAHHRLTDAIEIIAEIGYRAVAITLDHHALDPCGPLPREELDGTRRLLDRTGLACVVETGARFILDPRRKHQPTLLDPDAEMRGRRLEFLRRAIDIASELGASAVSLWSGATPPGQSADRARALLIDGCRELLRAAETRDVPLAFEPEPGMSVETLNGYCELAAQLDHPLFGLTLDVGHLHCLSDGQPAARIREFAGVLRNIHIEDMRRGRHEHLMFGEGEMDFEPIIAALGAVGYTGPVNVELSRHSHDAVAAARKAYAFLNNIIRRSTRPSGK